MFEGLWQLVGNTTVYANEEDGVIVTWKGGKTFNVYQLYDNKLENVNAFNVDLDESPTLEWVKDYVKNKMEECGHE